MQLFLDAVIVLGCFGLALAGIVWAVQICKNWLRRASALIRQHAP
jgi:hypothetical protein